MATTTSLNSWSSSTSASCSRTTFFVELDDPAKAQKITDRFAKLNWPKILERYVRLVNPLLHDVLKGLTHDLVVDQAEFATDMLFQSEHALALPTKAAALWETPCALIGTTRSRLPDLLETAPQMQ